MPGQVYKAKIKRREIYLKTKQQKKDVNGPSSSVSTGSSEGKLLIDTNSKSKQSNKKKMLKSAVSQDEKKKDDGSDNNPPDTVTRLTRNRLLLHQRQKTLADSPDDEKSNNNNNVKTKFKEEENNDKKYRASSLGDNAKKESKTEPQLSDKKKTEDTISTLKPRREKEKKTNIDSKDKNEKKSTFVMKTRSGRSSQPVVNLSAVNQQNKADENAKNTKKKKTNSSYRRSKKMYDEAGALITNGKDYCDCLELDCPGCHFPCKKCGSEKCGTECRCERNWVYDEVKIEGTGITVKNHAC